MELKILFKNTSYLVTTRVDKFAVGFIRAKLVAIYLGCHIARAKTITLSVLKFSLNSMEDLRDKCIEGNFPFAH